MLDLVKLAPGGQVGNDLLAPHFSFGSRRLNRRPISTWINRRALVPGQYIGAATLRVSAGTGTCAPTLPAYPTVQEGDYLVAYCMSAVETDTIAPTAGTWSTGLDDGSTANRQCVFGRPAVAADRGSTVSFTKTGAGGAWAVLIAVVRGVNAITNVSLARGTGTNDTPTAMAGVFGSFGLCFFGQETSGATYSVDAIESVAWTAGLADNAANPQRGVWWSDGKTRTSPGAPLYFEGTGMHPTGPTTSSANQHATIVVQLQTFAL